MRRSLSPETQIKGATQSASFTDPFKSRRSSLENELGLVAKADSKILSIGTRVGQFLSKKERYRHVGTIPQLLRPSHTLSGKEIAGTKRESEYEEFSIGSHATSGFSRSPDHPGDRDDEPVEESPTDSHKMSMFDYKVRLERIREQDRSGWRHWHRKY